MGDAKLPSYVGHASIGPLYIEGRFVTSSKRALSSAKMTCCQGLGATYSKGWLIMVGVSRMSPVPGSGMRRRHEH